MRTKPLALALLVLLAVPAVADRKDDLLRQAQAAASARKLDEAAAAYCELARLDSRYKSDCDANRMEMEAENKRNEARFREGVDFYNRNEFEDARQKLKNIRFGPRHAEAQRYLNNLIPQKERELEQARGAAAAEQQNTQRFNDAVQAYNRNDFGTAKNLFGQVQGAKAGEAQSYLSRIRQYESAMQRGNQAAAAGRYAEAKQAYDEAAAIKRDGPENPADKSNSMAAKLTQPSPTPAQVATTPTSSPSPAARPAPTPSQPVTRAAAVKTVEAPKVDTARVMREAADAEQGGDKEGARAKYIQVLAADPTHAGARTALERLKKEAEAAGRPTAAPVSKEADVMLVRGISEFYQGDYDAAMTFVRDYLDLSGAKVGLANFYMGAAKLTKYYLGGMTDKKLYNDATVAFRAAKGTPGFVPPGREYVAPKILKVYDSL